MDLAIDLAVIWDAVAAASTAAAKVGPCAPELQRVRLLSVKARALARSFVLRPARPVAARIHQRATLINGDTRAVNGWTAVILCLTQHAG